MKSLSSQKTSSYIPSREEIVQSASDLIPKLRERAEEAEDLRQMPDQNIADLKSAGIHKIFTPKEIWWL